MNEELQQALAALVSKTVGGVEAGSAFLQAEIPEVVQQLLIWKAAISGISMLGFFAMAYAIYRINKWQVGYWKKEFETESASDHPELIMNMFQLLLAFPLIALWSLDWLQIWLAPKVFLIEYAASLAK